MHWTRTSRGSPHGGVKARLPRQAGRGPRGGAARAAAVAQPPYFSRSSLSHSPHSGPTSPSWRTFHGSSKDAK